MSDKKGWVKSYRSVIDNPVATKTTDHMAVWVYLLHTATSKKKKDLFKGKEIILKPGQLITGRDNIAETYKNLNASKVQRILKDFEDAHQIEQQTSSKGRLITLINWNKYQSSEQPFEQQVNNAFSKNRVYENQNTQKSNNEMNNKKSTNIGINTEYLAVNSVRVNNDLNNKRTTTEQQLNNERTLYKNRENIKNVKNEREGALVPLGRFKNVFLTQNEIDELKAKFPNDYEAKIERLSRYLESTGKKYHNHFSTLLEWLEQDVSKSDNDKKGVRTASYDIEELDKFTPLDNY